MEERGSHKEGVLPEARRLAASSSSKELRVRSLSLGTRVRPPLGRPED